MVAAAVPPAGGESSSGHQAATEAYCLAKEPTYSTRYYIPEAYNWCVVPDHGQDAILFAGVAVCAACLAQGRFSNSLILLAGAAVQGFMLPYNLGRFGNGIAIWLGIEPYELFFYIFLPPLLLDAAVRIDFFLFKKVIVQVITLAFLVVGGSVGLMIPIMLYVLDLKSSGWNWQYVSLFISMLASTDAVAIIATMKTSGGPRRLRVLLEGEALLNDASSFTLFEIFLELVEQLNTTGHNEESGWAVFGEIVKNALKLGAGGLGIGLAFGIACRYALRFMRYMGATIDQQVSLTLALAYLSYYTANSPAHVSGVVSVAVYGLYGAATSKWDMSAKVEESGAFDAFWDTLSFVVNGIVFFFSGVACINFFVRSSQQLEGTNHGAVLASTIWRLPLIYIFMFIVRFVLTALFRPMFKIFLGDITWRELLFATAAGLRGSVSLILAQAVVTDQNAGGASDSTNGIIKSEIVLWTAGFVLMTLIINVPLLPLILRKTGLSKVSEGKQRMRKRAVKALDNHTLTSIDNLKRDEDEMLRGVDWESVQSFVSVDDIYAHFINPTLPPESGQSRLLAWPPMSRSKPKTKKPKSLSNRPSLVGEGGKLDTDRFFGRTKGWGGSGDLENAMFADEEDYLEEDGDVKDDDGNSENEEVNELTSASGSEFPFLSRRQEAPGLTRSNTFANFTRTSPLLPVTASGDLPGTLPSGPVKLDRSLKSGPEPTPPPPTQEDLQRSRSMYAASPSASRRPLLTQPSANSDGVGSRNAYIMTTAGPMMAPTPMKIQEEDGMPDAAAAGGGLQHDSPSSMPKLRISGEALRRLVAEGTSGRTWPKMRAQDGGGRPPLPFKSQQLTTREEGPSRAASARMGSMDLNEASNKTWGGPQLPSSASATTTLRSSAGAQQKARPSLFDAFDIERPTNRIAHKTVAKHKSIFDAFGVTDTDNTNGSLARMNSTTSTGSSKGGKGVNADASPQQTWTAGMTKGVPPRELIAHLKRNRSAPDLEEADDEALQELERKTPPPEDGLQQYDSGPSLEPISSMKPPPMGHLSESELIEARVRLIVGLKRYFHGKRIEGLLSPAALRILDNACDSCLEDPTSFNLWKQLEKDATGTFLVSILAHQTFFWRKVVLILRRRHSEKYRLFMYVRRGLAWPIRKAIGIVQHVLTRYMLTGIEVGIEYMLGLTYSPQVQLLKRHETATEVLEEIQDELDKVWKFILDREVEAPERFQAIQTYRATTAVLKQQLAFIKNLYDSGIVDDLERDELFRPIEKRERHLERRGPHYQNPSVIQILHNIPFLRHAPNRIVEILYKHGRLHMYRSGRDLSVWQRKSVLVVTSGLVKVAYTDPQNNLQEYFLASGGMLGLYTALTGQPLPGKVEAIAEGNALGKGPVVFELYQSGINLIRKQAAVGNELFQQIELDMLRLAALFIVERFKPRLMPYLLMILSQQQGSLRSAKSNPRGTRALTSFPSKNSRDEDSGSPRSFGDSTIVTDTLTSVKPQELLRDAVLEQYTCLQHDLAASEVLELPAGIPYRHTSSAVLLRGTLKTSGLRAGDGKKGEEKVIEYHAPFVFPFVPAADSSTIAPPLRFVAGYKSSSESGALLMVCPGENSVEGLSGQATPARPGNAESPRGGDAPVAMATPDLARSSRPNFRRMSKALVLNVHDTAEHAAAKRSDGRKGEWWDNALSRPSQALQRMSHLPGYLSHHRERAEATDGNSK